MTLDQWEQHLATRAGPALRAFLRRVLTREALRIEAEAKRHATLAPRVRSGRLRNSIAASVVPVEDRGVPGVGGMGILLRARGPYARVQEYGGTIRSSRPGGYLAIPLGPALTRAGVTRGGFASPRSVPGLFVIRSRRGNLLLARRKGEGIEPVFALVRSVTLTGKRYLRDPLAASHRRLVTDLGPALADALIPGGDR